MKSPNLTKFLILAAAAAALQMSAATAHEWEAARTFDNVVVFGDSLSDPGNVFALTHEFSVRPFAPIPSAPYLIGGLHFTNGPTWVERLSWALGTPTGAGPALRVPRLYRNYAFGGARARANSASASPSLSAQVAMYLGAPGGAASEDSLYVVWLGANDVRDALDALAVDPTGATSVGILQAALGSIGQNILTLYGAGARTLLVPNVPNMALTPAVASQPAPVPALAAQFSGIFNAGLEQTLANLESQLPGTHIVRLNIAALLQDVVSTPSLYGITNTTQPCLSFGVIAAAICATPQKYVFWDAVHPTAAVHRILAEHALTAVTP